MKMPVEPRSAQEGKELPVRPPQPALINRSVRILATLAGRVGLPVIIAWSMFYGASDLRAQPVGGPVFSNTNRQVTLGVLGGYFRRDIGGIKTTSPRAWLRVGYGLAARVDVFLLVGLTKVRLELPGNLQSELSDRYNPAYGGGITYRVWHNEDVGLSTFVTGKAFRFVSTPSRSRLATVAGTELVETMKFRYDWREANLGFGLLKQAGLLAVHAGLNMKYISRLEIQSNSLALSQDGSTLSQRGTRYLSGLLVSPQAGFEVLLPARVRLSFEVTGKSSDDVAFFVGISQTGIR